MKKLFKFKNLELTYPQSWTKQYNEIVIPEGFRLIRIWELWELLESKQADDFLGDLKGKFCYFWCEQTSYAKKYSFSSGLFLGRYLSVVSSNEYLANSNSYGQVVMVKLKENKSTKEVTK